MFKKVLDPGTAGGVSLPELNVFKFTSGGHATEPGFQISAMEESTEKAKLGLLPQLIAATWFALVAPAGTPRAIIERLNVEVQRHLAQPDTQRRFADLGMSSDGSTPEALDAYIKSEIAKWAKVIKDANIQQQE